MPTLLTANIGSYPRVGEDKDQQRYRRGYGHFERKEISAHAFRDVEQSVIQEIINEQNQTLIDEVTDGLIGWTDPISHFCKNLSGVERGGLRRYFNNNFYYRRPVFTAKPKIKGTVVSEEFRFAQNCTPKNVRAVVMGPVTLAVHTDATFKGMSTVASRADFFAGLISLEINALARMGAKVIQIDEPAVAASHDLLPLLKKVVRFPLPPNVRVVFAFYFGDLAPLWPILQDLPGHGLNLDMTSDSDRLFAKMRETPGTKDVGLGLVNGRETRLEESARIAETARTWLELTNGERVYLTPSCGLEFLPRGSARAKLHILQTAKMTLEKNEVA